MTVRQILVADQTKDARRADTKNDDTMIFSNKKSRLTQLLLHQNLSAAKWMASQHQLPISSDARSFVSLAQPGKGLPFHKHGKTYLTLVTGTKDWLIAPPKVRLTPQMLWTSNSSNYCFPIDSPVRRVRQHAGEILYLPEGWWHATINQGTEASLGIVQNINVPSKRLGVLLDKKRTMFNGSSVNGSSDDFLYDIPAFEAEESSHFEKLLLQADHLLNDTTTNQSHAAVLRWTRRKLLWNAQLKTAIQAYESSPKTTRRPELCLYVVQVSVGSAVDRIARESNTRKEDEGAFVVSPAVLPTRPQGLNAQDVLNRIALCELELTNAAHHGYLGTAAFSASLIELSRAIRFTELRMVHLAERDQSLGLFVTELNNEKNRLVRKALTVGARNGAVASVKSLWEAASMVCNQMLQAPDQSAPENATVIESESTVQECQGLLSIVLKESPAHMYANRLWHTLFPDALDSDVDFPKKKNGSMNGVDGRNVCQHETLLALIRDTHLDDVPVVFHSCLDVIPDSQKYEWLNAKDANTGQTAVMAASLKGRSEIVRVLCEHVDLDVGEKFGYVPIDGAAFSGNANVLRVLMSESSCNRPFDPKRPNRWDVPSPVDGYTPVWRAVWGSTPSHSEAVQVLLEMGKVDPDTPCDHACPGQYGTMLEYAVAIDNLETVKILLGHGAQVSDSMKNQVASRIDNVATCIATRPEDDCSRDDPVAQVFYEWSRGLGLDGDGDGGGIIGRVAGEVEEVEEEDPEDENDWMEYEIGVGDVWGEEE